MRFLQRERQAGMAGDNHGAETQENATAAQNQSEQETTQLSQVDYQAAIAERDKKIAALEEQVASAAKSVETAEKLSAQIDELRAQSESDRIDFKLQLAGVRNVKAARAVLEDHGGDVDTLKEAEPWLFADVPAKQQGGKTGLPNAGTSMDAGRTMKRWRRLAGLDDSNDNA